MIKTIINYIFIGLLLFIGNLSLIRQTSFDENDAYSTSYKAWSTAYMQKYTYNTIWAYIDFTQPSDVKRFHIMDGTEEIYSTYVAHGINSGDQLYADQFSNEIGSKETSLGVYKTGEYYEGKHGKSMRLIGLEWNINDNVYARNIVIHASNYAGPPINGHSWGCFAIPEREEGTTVRPIEEVLKLLQPGDIIVAYYPDGYWSKISKFLQGN